MLTLEKFLKHLRMTMKIITLYHLQGNHFNISNYSLSSNWLVKWLFLRKVERIN